MINKEGFVEMRVCADCGYNLRGLAGNPIRCPECGRVCRVEDLQVPSFRLSLQLRQMEEVSTACVGTFLLVALVFTMRFCLPATFVKLGPVFREVLTFALPALWIALARRFGVLTSWGQGWLRVLIVFHAVGVLGVALIGIIWLGGILLSVHSAGDANFTNREMSLCVGAIVLAVVCLFTIIPRIYKKANTERQKLQRTIAHQWSQLDRPRA